jgi:hypothetical protein
MTLMNSFIQTIYAECLSITRGEEEEDTKGIGPMPNLDRIQSMRTKPESYAYFCVHFIPAIVGERNWTKLCRATMGVKETFKRLVTVSDEAFALLLLENYWDRWVAEWEEKKKADEDGRDVSFKGLPKTRYSENNPDIKKFGGWRRGAKRYNELYQDVELERSNREDSTRLDEEMDKRYERTEARDNESGVSRVKRGNDEDHVDIVVDLDD